jgi:hypothetical protein
MPMGQRESFDLFFFDVIDKTSLFDDRILDSPICFARYRRGQSRGFNWYNGKVANLGAARDRHLRVPCLMNARGFQ